VRFELSYLQVFTDAYILVQRSVEVTGYVVLLDAMMPEISGSYF
jgi:hypothetical protein